MSPQLDMFAVFDARSRRDVMFYLGPVARDGASKYVHLIRDKDDPVETKARGAEARATGERRAGYAKRMGKPEDWRARIVAHLADGKPRTFNAICVELIGCTADVMFDNAPDVGLWLAVERMEVALTHEAPIFFVHRDGIAR